MDIPITLRSKVAGYLVLAVLKTAGCLPLRVLHRLSRLIGRVYWIVSPLARRTILGNLEIGFPQLPNAQRLRIGRESLCGTVQGFLESGKWAFGGTHGASCLIEGLEHLLAAKAQGRGVLLLGLHYNDVVGAVTLLNRYVPVGAMYLKFRHPALDAAVREGHSRHVKMFERSDVFAITSALRNGEVIWFAPDQSYRDKRQVFAPFFGVAVPTLTSLSRFVRMLGVEVVPFSHRRFGDTFQVVFSPPLKGLGADELADAIQINRLIEAAVRERPEAYAWINWQLRYWRSRQAATTTDWGHLEAHKEHARTATTSHSFSPHTGASTKDR